MADVLRAVSWKSVPFTVFKRLDLKTVMGDGSLLLALDECMGRWNNEIDDLVKVGIRPKQSVRGLV